MISDSGTAIEEIALAANGAGGFQLVVQAREPLDPAATATINDAPITEVAASGARKDSELLQSSFALSRDTDESGADVYRLEGAPPDSDGNQPPTVKTAEIASPPAPPATAPAAASSPPAT